MKPETQAEKQPRDDISDLLPLLRYVMILAKKYPDPISHKTLADSAHVSKAAVSKVRDRLYRICDDRTLGRRRKLLLRTDDKASPQVVGAFFFGGELKPFFKSPYGKALLRRWVGSSYRKIAKAAPKFQEFFTEDDAIFVSELFVSALAESVSKVDFSILNMADEAEARYALMAVAVTIYNRLGLDIQRCVKDEKTVLQLLTVRDKAWFLLLEVIDAILEKVFWEFLSQLPDEQTRRAHLSMYRQTVIFYLGRKVFDEVTQQVKMMAEKNKVRFEEQYLELGHFFRPPAPISVSAAANDEKLLRVAVGKAELEKEPSIELSSH